MADTPAKATTIPREVVQAVSDGGRFPDTQVGEGWMNPGRPITHVIAEEVDSRRYDYDTATNLRYMPKIGEGVPFQMLRAFAGSYDLLRIVIERRKDQIEGHEWKVVPRKRTLTMPSTSGKDDARVEALTAFFEHPSSELDWSQWLRAALEDLLVCDGIAVVPRRTLAGDVYSLDLVDVATIKRIIDDRGFTPAPPDIAYQQIVKGIPASDFTTEELYYWLRNPATYRLYGMSPVEWIVITVQTALNRQASTLSHFTDGNMPDALMGLPDTWNLDTVREFQSYWDSLVGGKLDQRRGKMKFVPFDPSKLKELKQPDLKQDFDEWLARLICFAFSIAPTGLIKDQNRATAATGKEQATEDGLMPLLSFIKRRMDFIIQRVAGYTDLEWTWERKKEVDPLQQAQIHNFYVGMKVLTPDEVREDLGKAALTPEQRAEAFPAPPAIVPGEDDTSGASGSTSGVEPKAAPSGKDEGDDATKGIHLHVNVEAPVIKVPAAQVLVR
jgi:hypothetical protein